MAEVQAEQGTGSTTLEFSQACLPLALDLIPSLATLKDTNGSKVLQTHVPHVRALTIQKSQ